MAFISARNRKILLRIELWAFEVSSTSFWLSDMLLSIVLYQLIVIQADSSLPDENDLNHASRESLNEVKSLPRQSITSEDYFNQFTTEAKQN